ncbi:sulfurtransferase TusA family protein [Roseicyclus sp. F158]|uniref:Sulfurtransferase TusA family protein n=1 Tax=Tropicimonas omnivorans TaxID=3075590 RepID=A0ABU3DJX7_9RHOB|nr:sulfurtransferase TusA family protein [Roseicyclus sp. F158]MDT0684018.1 sulfurtransferase TusA family protein [Roseicyclus sp. F158]
MGTGSNDIAEEVDALGLLCPLPVLRARKRLMALPEGAALRILTDDPAALIDMPHFCAESGHTLLGAEDISGGTAFTIRKGSA